MRIGASLGVHNRHGAITIAPTTSAEATLDPANESAPGLVTEIIQVRFVFPAEDRGDELTGSICEVSTGGDGKHFDAPERELAQSYMHLGLVAPQAILALHNDGVKRLGAGGRKKTLVPIPMLLAAADLGVCVDMVFERPTTESRRVLPAQRDLVLD